MNITELGQNWNELGKRDPLWAILSAPEKRNRGWDLAEFLATGQVEIDGVCQYVQSLGVTLRRGKSLDFGCGVGRLTQAMCLHFDQCTGIDIAPSMIKQARELNAHGSRCTYVLNERDDLSVLGDQRFDFIYSNIVLQHMAPEYSEKYIQEFVRLLAPDGILIFQVPSHLVEVSPPPKAGAEDLPVPDAPEERSSLVPGSAALPDSAYCARITPSQSEIVAKAASQIQVEATIQNGGDATWHGLDRGTPVYPIRLGNHWLTPAGEMIALDDGRTELPISVEPGGSIDLSIGVNTPGTPGEYVLELDLVHELICWFADRGSQTARIRVTVTADEMQPLGDEHQDRIIPNIEMHALRRDRVEQIIRESGGRLLDVQNDQSAAEWVSFRYCVVK